MNRLAVTLCLLLLLFAVGEQTKAAPPQRAALPPKALYAPVDARFGIVESYVNPTEANNLGVAWTRVLFQWADVQAGGPGAWTPTVSDGQINNEIANGRTVVGLLIGIPGWARADGLPAGLNLPHDDPNNTWANFVREAVGRYNGRINHWIIWNEPDINDANAPGYTWHGSAGDFFQLQRTAYLVAKETNANATIHLPAFTYFWNPNYIYEFLDVVVADPSAPEHNYYFDAITAHLYFRPDAVYSIIQNFYGAVQSRGIPWKPLWLVETNAPPSNDPAWPVPNWTFQVTLEEQAAYIPQALALGIAAGAQRIAIYKLQDLPSDAAANPEPFGLIRMDGTRRPAFQTYQVAIRYLAGVQGARRQQWDHVAQVRLDQGGHTTHVLFSRLPAAQQAEVEATANTAVLVDMWGGRRTISARDGLFTVDLPGAPCVQTAGDYCMIGGPVLYLVQAKEDGAAPPAPPVGGGPPPTSSPAAAATTADPDAPALDTTATAVSSETETAVTAAATNTPPSPTPRPSSTPRPTATRTAVPTTVPTDTPSPTPTTTPTTGAPTTGAPATEVAERQRAPALPQTATTGHPPTPTTNLSLLFIGGGLLLVLGLAGWWWRYGR